MGNDVENIQSTFKYSDPDFVGHDSVLDVSFS